MAIMQHRMATEPDLWDQAGYNLELWFPSRGPTGMTMRPELSRESDTESVRELAPQILLHIHVHMCAHVWYMHVLVEGKGEIWGMG